MIFDDFFDEKIIFENPNFRFFQIFFKVNFLHDEKIFFVEIFLNLIYSCRMGL